VDVTSASVKIQRRQRLFSWAPVVAAAAAIAIAAVFVLKPSGQASSFVGKTAPQLALRDTLGATESLAALRGHPVLLNFWGVSCPPCRTEVPILQQAYARYLSKGLVILGVDEQLDDAQSVIVFASEHGATYPLLLDPTSSAMQPYRLDALPRSFLIDRSGIIRADEKSPFLDKKTLEAALKQIL
jgi:cytochrome c biogenesis protein CcmG/thiol:disulfide interchange protein DsbE